MREDLTWVIVVFIQECFKLSDIRFGERCRCPFTLGFQKESKSIGPTMGEYEHILMVSKMP
jgi:hypothetical protein